VKVDELKKLKLDWSTMSDQPRLKVPTLSFVDKTPTPTRLLKAVDEIGLQLDSAKSTASSSNNPFDEHFRKALTCNKKVSADASTTAEQTKEANDEMLNTPLILPEFQSAPPTANVIADVAATVTRTKSRKFKPIVPINSCGGGSSSTSSSAQLLLKMPSGSTIHLSQIPFIQERPAITTTDLEATKSLGGDKKRKGKSQMLSETDKDDLKARNRAAASRSRHKKKKMTEGFQRQIQIMAEKNKQLVQENSILKKEIVHLKNQIDDNKTAPPVIITLDQSFAPVQQQ